MENEFKTFKEFYPYYLNEHKKMGTRLFHFVGTLLFFLFLGSCFYFKNWSLVAPTIIAPYLFAWVSHFFIEKNKPATFKYPLMSLRGDFKLFFQLIIGKEKFKIN